jgi:hypothetical protein
MGKFSFPDPVNGIELMAVGRFGMGKEIGAQ